MRFDEDAKLVEKASGTDEEKLVDVSKFCDGLKCDGYEGSEVKSRGSEIEIKWYVATTCSHANQTSSCSVLAFYLAGRRGLGYLWKQPQPNSPTC